MSLAADPDVAAAAAAVAAEPRTAAEPGAAADPLAREPLARRLAEIVALGPRFAGTPGERACRHYLVRELSLLGAASIEEEPFPYLGYQPVAAACELVGGDLPLPCRPLQSTANAVTEGSAVYVGDGTQSDIESVEQRLGGLAGHVVVAQPPNLFDTAAALASRGIAALVNVAPTASGLIGSFTASLYPPPLEPPWEGRILPFPGVTVEASAARRLLALVSSGPVRLRVEHRAIYSESESANVVATLPGTAWPEEVVIVGAHYDTQLDCPGAWDNGTGLASLMQIAEALAGSPCPRTIRFVAFGAEEPALWGSYTHTVRRREELSRVVGMVNLDTVGAPVNGPRVLVASPGMRALAGDAAELAGWGAFEWEHPDEERYFDHTPFADAGVPVACLLQHRLSHPYYHSPGDTLDLVDLGSMAAAARAAAATVISLASVDPGGLPERHVRLAR